MLVSVLINLVMLPVAVVLSKSAGYVPFIKPKLYP